ncbi:hypothetical protein IWQ60_011550 [Tieghemiomyces parasiticus]|uniref:F-box/LRR-repeat protein 15-like leucin rich repeat domain-containing protein n=1 Tax=Tieghemiomyces parasiticus TaxID=78921 RepID=A0A9W8DH67_9FUNG|nr:hypothetical protein IWQ60_011550 [Tieghemiomyces parasiticus]
MSPLTPSDRLAARVLDDPHLLERILGYLDRPQLLRCCLVNRIWFTPAAAHVYHTLHFGPSGHSALNTWLKFIITLPRLRPEVRQLPRRLVLADPSGGGLPLYYTPDPLWLRQMLVLLPNLDVLLLHRCDHLQSANLRALEEKAGTCTGPTLARNGSYPPFPRAVVPNRVATLVLTHHDNIGRTDIARLPDLFPNLIRLDLTGTHGVTDESLGLLADRCTNLRDLAVGHTRRVTDTGLLTLAKMRRSQLQALRLVAVHAITDAGLVHLTRFCTQLRVLVLRGCPKLTSSGLLRALQFSPSRGGHLRHLDVTQCLALRWDSALWSWLAHYGVNLSSLALSYTFLPNGQNGGGKPEALACSHVKYPPAPAPVNAAACPAPPPLSPVHWPALTRLRIDLVPETNANLEAVTVFAGQLHLLHRLALCDINNSEDDGSNFYHYSHNSHRIDRTSRLYADLWTLADSRPKLEITLNGHRVGQL